MPSKKPSTTSKKGGKGKEAAATTATTEEINSLVVDPASEDDVFSFDEIKEEQIEDEEEFKVFGQQIGGIPYFLRAGEVISLDLRRCKYLILPGIRMTPDYPTATIPDEIKEDALKCLMRSLEYGDIVKGEEYIPIFRKEEGTIKKFIKLLDNDAPSMKKKVGKAVQASYRSFIDGHHVYNLLQTMIKHEQDHRYRKSHMSILQSALSYVRSDVFVRGPVGNVSSEEVLKDNSQKRYEDRRAATRQSKAGRRPA